MVLPTSGNPISLNQVNVELSQTATAQIALNDTAVRGLIGKSANVQFALSELYGVSSVVGWIYNSYTLIPNSPIHFNSVVVNSSGDVFALLVLASKVNGREVNALGNTSQSNDLKQTIELHRLNDDGVLQDRNSYQSQGGYKEGLGLLDVLNPDPYANRNANRLTLDGTSKVFAHITQTSWRMWQYQAYTDYDHPTLAIYKFNQSNLEQEDSRWHHIHMNGRTTSYFGGSPYTLRVPTYQGFQGFPKTSSAFMNGNNKYTILWGTFQENNQQSYIVEARYPASPSYNSAPENISAVRITGTYGGYFSQAGSATSGGIAFPYNTSENWHLIHTNEHGYCLFRKTATTSTSTYNSYYSQSNGGTRINTASVTKVNTSAHVRDLKKDGNGNPAVFGYGGTKSYNGTIQDGVWCQKFNSSGVKTKRFSFSGNNPTSGSGHVGKYLNAVFDSDDNCYMAGESLITRNADGVWTARGTGHVSTTKPYITWIACFNTNGVYQWHKYFDTKEWNAGWASGMSSYAQYYPPTITEISLTDDEDLLLSGTAQFHPGNGYGDHWNAFVMKLPRDGNVSNGFVGHTRTMPWGHTANIGIQIGEFGGTNDTSGAQFFACNDGHTQSYQNDLYETSTVSWNLWSSSLRNDSNNNTSTMSQSVKTHQSSAIPWYGVVHANATAEKLAITTPPTEATNAGKVEF